MPHNPNATFVLGDPSSIGRWLGRAYGEAFAVAAGPRSNALSPDAQRLLRRARQVLSPREVAVLDLLEGKNFSIQDVAGRTGQSAAEVSGLYRCALDALVADLEACANDREVAQARRKV